MTEQFTHDQFMALALKQASYGQLIARPNPAVGCVLVKTIKWWVLGLPKKLVAPMPK